MYVDFPLNLITYHIFILGLNFISDFTLNDCANAPKPVSRVKKSAPAEAVPPELPWDRIQDEDFDIVEEILEDGCKTFVYRRKKQVHKPEDNIDTRPGIEYPEIVWYLISHYIKPEEVGHFAGINKATYAITKRESFWRTLYKRYCQNHPKLPERLRIENSYMVYGLQQRVIRALYHTYDVFINKVSSQQLHDYKPHALLKRRCVNVWYRKAPCYWIVYFKLKRVYGCQRETEAVDFIEELGRIDANPEEDSQVLQVHSLIKSFSFCDVLFSYNLLYFFLLLTRCTMFIIGSFHFK